MLVLTGVNYMPLTDQRRSCKSETDSGTDENHTYQSSGYSMSKKNWDQLAASTNGNPIEVLSISG